MLDKDTEGDSDAAALAEEQPLALRVADGCEEPEGDVDEEAHGDALVLEDGAPEALLWADIDGLAKEDSEELSELDAEVEGDTRLDAVPLLEKASVALPYADADTLTDADADAEPLYDTNDTDDSADGLSEPNTVLDAETQADALTLLEGEPEALPREEIDALPDTDEVEEAQAVTLALPE